MNDVKTYSEGSIIKAVYRNQILSEYSNNPLIEALPPIMNFEQVESLIHSYPQFDESERNLDAEYRYHCIQRLFNYFQPWDIHFEIERKISRTIRQGYLSRNPITPNYAADLQGIYQSVKYKDAGLDRVPLSYSKASGFTIIGFSGVGKTTSIDKILSLYPQVIVHDQYRGTTLNHNQLVWMKLDCPFVGSIKGLCSNFFMEFDRLLGDNTYSKFASGRNTTTDVMIPRMALLARRQDLGILVIDEIQHLSAAKSGGSEKMLNFFVTLVNKIGIPVILIGTTKALGILQGEFRQARRGSGQQGDVIWERMDKNIKWDLLIRGMWNFQWTKQVATLTDEINDVLYEESQGIVDIAVKLYAMAQIHAIATRKEIITADIIRKVAKQNLKLVRPMLLALKSGKIKEINKYGDISPIDIDAFCEEQLKSITLNSKIENAQQSFTKAKLDNTELFEEAVIQLVAYDIKMDEAKSTVKQLIEAGKDFSDVAKLVKAALKVILSKEFSTNKESKKVVRLNKTQKDKNDLREIVDKGRKLRKSAYEALKEAGVIKCPVEEFIMLG